MQGRPSPWRVFDATSLGVLLSAVNVSAISVALPSVVRHFGATPAQASWILVAYLLSNTVMILIFGRLADHLGRARLYRIGLAILTMSSLLCGLAPSVEVLIVFQLAQGIGAAVVISNIVALLADHFPASRLGVAIGWNTALVSISQVIGPVLGGVLTSAFGWRAIFWFNVPVGLVGLVLAFHTLRGKEEVRRGAVDIAGCLFYGLAMGGLAVVFVNAGSGQWTAPLTLVGLGLAVTFFPVLLFSQTRSRASFLERSVFQGAQRNAAYLATFCVATSRTAVVVLVAVYVQSAKGAGAMDAGLSVFPMAMGMALAAAVSGSLGSMLALNRIAALGAVIAAIGLGLLGVLLQPELSSAGISACLFMIGIGVGIFLGPNTTLILSQTASSQRGVVNGLRSTLQNFAYVSSSALVLAFMAHGLSGQQRQAVYSGATTALGQHGVSTLTANCQLVLWTLAVIALAGAAASWREGGSRRAGPVLGPRSLRRLGTIGQRRKMGDNVIEPC